MHTIYVGVDPGLVIGVAWFKAKNSAKPLKRDVCKNIQNTRTVFSYDAENLSDIYVKVSEFCNWLESAQCATHVFLETFTQRATTGSNDSLAFSGAFVHAFCGLVTHYRQSAGQCWADTCTVVLQPASIKAGAFMRVVERDLKKEFGPNQHELDAAMHLVYGIGEL